ncbi:MAG: arginase, partial [Bacteroidetes bacterium]|nr:arginase [Bacteroidota bacterium]
GLGAGKKGAELGPFALRIACGQIGYDLFARNDVETFINDHNYYATSDKYQADYIKQLVDFNELTCNAAADAFNNYQKILMLTGDHSNAVGSVSGLKKAFPNAKIGVIWIDAHADLHSPYSTPSQNFHGMPLAALCGVNNKQEKTANPPLENIPQWERFKEIGGKNISPKIKPSDIVFIDIRDLEQPEWDLIKEHNIKYFAPIDRIKLGINAIIDQSLEYHHDKDIIYITFDVDSLDPSISRGTGTPVDGGLSVAEATTLLKAFYHHPKTKMLEVTEINPLIDNRNQMAMAAARILKAVGV